VGARRGARAAPQRQLVGGSRRRIERHLAEARLPIGKTFDSFDFEAVPVVSKAQLMALAAGDSWLDNGANLLLFGPPGAGKSHLACAIGFALVENGRRVLFTRTSDLVQRLQVARRELALDRARPHLLIQTVAPFSPRLSRYRAGTEAVFAPTTEGSTPRPVASPSQQGSNQRWMKKSAGQPS
jgi:hypothetical protein